MIRTWHSVSCVCTKCIASDYSLIRVRLRIHGERTRGLWGDSDIDIAGLLDASYEGKAHP